jgi:hypothetical protein
MDLAALIQPLSSPVVERRRERRRARSRWLGGAWAQDQWKLKRCLAVKRG